MKRILTMFLAAMMLLPLVACGSTIESDDNSASELPEVSYDKQNLESILSAITTETETAIQKISGDSAAVVEKLGKSYDTYDANKTNVTDFYSNSLKETEALYAGLEAISMDYFKCVGEQGLDDYDTWDNAMEDFYDVWDNAMEDYYDAWDNAYEEVYDQCDNLIKDASSEIEYSEYSDIWSEMYEEYSDAWSEMYETYSDAWSETYSNYTDVWSGFYNNQTDVEAILKAAAEQKNKNEDTSDDTAKTDIPAGNAPESTTEETTEMVDGIRRDFKEAMDNYEAFFDEYVAFMKKYAASDGSDPALLADYATYMSKYADVMADLEAWDSKDMNTAEIAYYIEVQSRINQKLLEVA